MIDYLIVGSGLAGISFSEIALNNNKTILVLDNNSQNSSRIAGGLYNPVILKRFSEVWQAEPQLVIMNQFYADLRQKIEIEFDFKKPILRKFYSVEEQNNWFSASDKATLAPSISSLLALASPIPLAPPVITTTLSLNIFINSYSDNNYTMIFLLLQAYL